MLLVSPRIGFEVSQKYLFNRRIHTNTFIVIIHHYHHFHLYLLYRLSLQERRMRVLTHMMDLNLPTTRALLR